MGSVRGQPFLAGDGAISSLPRVHIPDAPLAHAITAGITTVITTQLGLTSGTQESEGPLSESAGTSPGDLAAVSSWFEDNMMMMGDEVP